jgi:hypothetical protein
MTTIAGLFAGSFGRLFSPRQGARAAVLGTSLYTVLVDRQPTARLVKHFRPRWAGAPCAKDNGGHPGLYLLTVQQLRTESVT